MAKKKDFNNLKQWLKPKIKRMGLTVKEFAFECELSPAAVYNYMTDLNRPDLKTITKICQVLGRPVEEGLAQYTPRHDGRPIGRKDSYKRKRRKPMASTVEETVGQDSA